MKPKRRTRIAKGVYSDTSGWGVTVKVGNTQREKRFPRGTDLAVLKAWQNQTRGQLLLELPAQPRPVVARASLAAEAVRYLKLRVGLPSFKADRAHLTAWVERYGDRERRSLTTDDVRTALAEWRLSGQRRPWQTTARPLAPQTFRHRLRVLKSLWRTLDGPDAVSPADRVQAPKTHRAPPRDVELALIRRVASQLANRFPLAHARLLVLATTGRRPVEVMRTDPARDLDLRRSLWRVPGAKDGAATTLPLNADMRAAWKHLIAVGALGAYDTGLYAKQLRACGWPVGLRPYNVRHAVAMAILRAGGDVGDVQAHLGHTSIETTRRFYAGVLQTRARKVSATLAGRVTLASGASVSPGRPAIIGEKTRLAPRGKKLARVG